MYKQNRNALYCPANLKLHLSTSAIEMTYMEMLDETYLDITQIHDCCEICFCVENCLTMNVGGNEYELSPGDFLLIMPGLPHNAVYRPEEKKKYFDIMFEFPYMEKDDEKNRPLSTKLNKLSRLGLASQGTCPVDRIRSILDKMEKELTEKNTGWFFLLRGYCLEFLINCLREVIGPVTERPPEMNNLNLAMGITKFMHDNYGKRITLMDVAEAIHVSPRHAQRIFKDLFGTTYAKALTLYRISHAKSYLVNTDLSIDDIAEMVGFSSSQPLYKFFREQENMPITQYRTKQKERMSDLNCADS